MTRDEILDSLKHKTWFTNGKEYKTPGSQLMSCLLEKNSGLIDLELTEVKK